MPAKTSRGESTSDVPSLVRIRLAIDVLGADGDVQHPKAMAALAQKKGETMLDGKNRTTNSGLSTRYLGAATVYLRLALGIGFLSAVADRFGLWGRFGTPGVAWGNFHNFLAYTAKLNPWLPASWIPGLGWIATLCEFCFGVALIIGYYTRLAAVLSGLLTLAFALAMVFSVGIHAPLSYSVFAVSAGAFLLAGSERYPWALDRWRGERQSAISRVAGQEGQIAA